MRGSEQQQCERSNFVARRKERKQYPRSVLLTLIEIFYRSSSKRQSQRCSLAPRHEHSPWQFIIITSFSNIPWKHISDDWRLWKLIFPPSRPELHPHRPPSHIFRQKSDFCAECFLAKNENCHFRRRENFHFPTARGGTRKSFNYRHVDKIS